MRHLFKSIHSSAPSHSGMNANNARIALGLCHQCVSKIVCVRLCLHFSTERTWIRKQNTPLLISFVTQKAPRKTVYLCLGLDLLSSESVVLGNPVHLVRSCFCRKVAAALFCDDVEQHRTHSLSCLNLCKDGTHS